MAKITSHATVLLAHPVLQIRSDFKILYLNFYQENQWRIAHQTNLMDRSGHGLINYIGNKAKCWRLND
jgi:hypothetical protein